MKSAAVLLLLAAAACGDTRVAVPAPSHPPAEGPASVGQTPMTPAPTPSPSEKVVRTEEEWKRILTAEQYHVLREKGTERAYTGEYTDTKTPGTYTCAGCGEVLFRSEGKFDSHCGWPAFDRPAEGIAITETRDVSHGMVRTEVTCPKCGGHLGHLFDDGPTDTGMRYCINSVSVKLKPDAPQK